MSLQKHGWLFKTIALLLSVVFLVSDPGLRVAYAIAPKSIFPVIKPPLQRVPPYPYFIPFVPEVPPDQWPHGEIIMKSENAVTIAVHAPEDPQHPLYYVRFQKDESRDEWLATYVPPVLDGGRDGKSWFLNGLEVIQWSNAYGIFPKSSSVPLPDNMISKTHLTPNGYIPFLTSKKPSEYGEILKGFIEGQALVRVGSEDDPRHYYMYFWEMKRGLRRIGLKLRPEDKDTRLVHYQMKAWEEILFQKMGKEEIIPAEAIIHEVLWQDPEEAGQQLYERFIAKSNILRVKKQGGDWEVPAARNDELLKKLRYSEDPKQRKIYEGIENAYLAHVRRFVAERIAPRAFEIDALDVVPLDLYQDMVREGLVGTQFRQVDGGVGLSSKAWLRVNFDVAEVSSGVTLGALNVLGSLGPDPLEKPVENPRADAQRREVLRKLLHGEAIVVFSLTEPGAGSDNAGLITQVKNGLLNGTKTWITVGTVLPADYEQILKLPKEITSMDQVPTDLRKHWPQIGENLKLWNALRRQTAENVERYKPMEHWQVIAARTQPRDPQKPHKNIGALLVKTKDAMTLPTQAGQELVFSEHMTAKKEPVVGQRGSGTTTFSYRDFPVDLELANIGTLTDFLKTLSRGRFTISAHGIGMLRGFKKTLAAAVKERSGEKEFAQGEMNAVMLAHAQDLLKELDALDILYTQILEQGAELKDAGKDIMVPAALAKILTATSAEDMSIRVGDALADLGYRETLEIKGLPPHLAPAGQYAAMRLNDAKLLPIGEGTTQIQQVKIVTPALLERPDLENYQTDIENLSKNAPQDSLARVIADIVAWRNEAIPVYRQHKDDILQTLDAQDASQAATGPEVKLSQVVFQELPALEAQVHTLLAGYRHWKELRDAGNAPDAESVHDALEWYANQTMRWLLEKPLHYLPPTEAMKLYEKLPLLAGKMAEATKVKETGEPSGKTFVVATPARDVSSEERARMDALVRKVIEEKFRGKLAYPFLPRGGGRVFLNPPDATVEAVELNEDYGFLEKAAKKAGVAEKFATRRIVLIAGDADPALFNEGDLDLIGSSGNFGWDNGYGFVKHGSHYIKATLVELAMEVLGKERGMEFLEAWVGHETEVLDAGKYVEPSAAKKKILDEGYAQIKQAFELKKSVQKIVRKTLREVREDDITYRGAASDEAFNVIVKQAEQGALKTNLDPAVGIPSKIASVHDLARAMYAAMEHAQETGKTFVPVLYLKDKREYEELQKKLEELGIAPVLQGKKDLRIFSDAQVLAQPEKFLPFLVSFVPEVPLPAKPVPGSAPKHSSEISQSLVRDAFAQAVYEALTKPSKGAGTQGIFVRLLDSDENQKMLVAAGEEATGFGMPTGMSFLDLDLISREGRGTRTPQAGGSIRRGPHMTEHVGLGISTLDRTMNAGMATDASIGSSI